MEIILAKVVMQITQLMFSIQVIRVQMMFQGTDNMSIVDVQGYR